MPYKQILVSLDCAEEEKNVIHEAVRLAATCKAKLLALHVNDPGAGKAHMMMGGLPRKTEDDLRSQFRNLGYEKEAGEINVMIVEGENYPKEIAKASKDVDLLVLGHFHKNRLLAAFIDSVDERVTDLASCPILIVPCGS